MSSFVISMKLVQRTFWTIWGLGAAIIAAGGLLIVLLFLGPMTWHELFHKTPVWDETIGDLIDVSSVEVIDSTSQRLGFAGLDYEAGFLIKPRTEEARVRILTTIHELNPLNRRDRSRDSFVLTEGLDLAYEPYFRKKLLYTFFGHNGAAYNVYVSPDDYIYVSYSKHSASIMEE